MLFFCLAFLVYLSSIAADPRDLATITVDEVIAGFASKTFTSVQLVTAYIARIAEINPTLNCVLEVNPDALKIAAGLDAERLMGISRGPLHGVPILIKDNIATFDKMNNTAGSFALLGAKVPRDSTVAAKLRSAGVVILGKTALSQWANFRSYNSSNGWNARGGQCYGAYLPLQDPSGSSSGSGASSSVGLAVATLGSETDGSIVSPSSKQSLVGIKPTVGLVSRSLVIPISAHQDTVGPMARTVKDAAYLLTAIVGYDKGDNYTAGIPWTVVPDYVGACKLTGLQGIKIGIPRQVFNITGDKTLTTAFAAALATMITLGATVQDVTFTNWTQFSKSSNELLVLELDFMLNLKQYTAQLTHNPHNITDLASLTKFTKTFPAEMWSTKRDVQLWDDSLKLNYTIDSKKGYKMVLEDQIFGGIGGILGALNNNKLDVLVLPTDYASTIAAVAGYPIITVPMGYYPAGTPVTMNGIGTLVETGPNTPFGVSFISRRFSEVQLIAYAYAFEQATLARDKVKPIYLPTTQLILPAVTATTSSSSSTANSCFAASESLTLESGDLISISNVKVGDCVLAADASGKTHFSEVVYIPHGANSERSNFVHISTEDKDVKMTENHILPSGLCGSTLSLVYASKVSIGDCIETLFGQEKVTSIEIVQSSGVYTVVTNKEYIVVNGIIASSFGANHMMANLFYNIHRFFYAISPSSLNSSFLKTVNEGLGIFIPFFGLTSA